MMHNATFVWQGCRFGILLAATAWACFVPRSATASINLSISPATSTVAAGSDGDAFDVTLTNTGTGAVTVGSFAFELSVSSSLIDFTSATVSTSAAPYIFAGSSLFGPMISTLASGGTLDASDLTTSSTGVTIASGSTVGLGHVFFNVSASAPTSAIPVEFTAFPVTNLSDASSPRPNNIPINSLTSGMIDIQATSVVPEPSMFTIFSIGIGLVGVFQGTRAAHRRVYRTETSGFPTDA